MFRVEPVRVIGVVEVWDEAGSWAAVTEYDDRRVRLRAGGTAPRDVNTPEDYEALLGE